MTEFCAWLSGQMTRYAWTPAHLTRWTCAGAGEVERWLAGEAVPELEPIRVLAYQTHTDILWLLRTTGWLRDRPLIPNGQDQP